MCYFRGKKGEEGDNAHCVLLGPNYTVKKTWFTQAVYHLDDSMNHLVTMAKNHGFLPIGVEWKAKTFFQQCHLSEEST